MSERIKAQVEVVPVRFTSNKFSVSLKALTLVAHPNRRMVLVVWVAGPADAIKALSANMKSEDCGYTRLTIDGDQYAFDHDEYTVQRFKLPEHNYWQLIIRTTRKGFLLGGLKQAMRTDLLSSAFTTPILPEWIDWIVNQAVNQKLVESCNNVMGVEGFISKLDSHKLDKIVTQGIKTGALRIGNATNQHGGRLVTHATEAKR